MEPRLIVAYALILGLLVCLAGAILRMTQRRRAAARAYRRHQRLRLAKATENGASAR